MNKISLTQYALYGIVVLSVLYLIVSMSARSVHAVAPSSVSVATTSNPTVGPLALTLFATTTCSSRVITTAASAVMLTFSDYAGQTPTGSFGHLQGASTTVSYDSGTYGCGLFKAYAFSSTTITVTETR